MSKILDEDLKLVEQSIYLPLVLSVLEYDRKVTEITPFKIKLVYVDLIEHTMLKVQKDLKKINEEMRKLKMKVIRGNNDGLFTEYNIYYKGYHEEHRFFNANLKNNTQKLLSIYLIGMYHPLLKD
ncbi:hypothetical protein M4D71_00765 [Niallia taxi]|uniref:hypothetical protein n=1 Tax=Niallia taxi TaxID=2499688 RepID=UPI0021A67251|nr:hypothetical protein [Niallia taxi]MCT2342651.1 hypothetical protein [Niallia taxi]